MEPDPGRPVLYGYWRSSSSYRVRIALNLKGIDFKNRPVDLLRGGGEQNQPAYRAINPLGLVPSLRHDGRVVTQSMVICEYLDEVFPGPRLMPDDVGGRARVRGLAQSIASEIQPLNNVAVMNYLKQQLGQDSGTVGDWYRHWIARGFGALEHWLEGDESGECCHGDRPGLADCFLVPQVYNAERFACDLTPYPNIRRITRFCRALPEFREAAPENQPDAAES